MAGLLAPLSAAADTITPGDEGELARFLPPVEGKRVCFARVYDADHLARHPKQKVTQLEFTLQDARNTVRTLQHERELAEQIQKGIKQLRSRTERVVERKRTA